MINLSSLYKLEQTDLRSKPLPKDTNNFWAGIVIENPTSYPSSLQAVKFLGYVLIPAFDATCNVV
jgi:hypothetical protein